MYYVYIHSNLTLTRFNRDVDPLHNLSLTLLHFGESFDKQIDMLPPTLTHLTLGLNFNQKIDHLPHSLTHLTLGRNFDQIIEKLPPRLSLLELGSCFNQELDSLPRTLKILRFFQENSQFDKPLQKLPPTLTELCVCGIFNHPLNMLPSSLTYLSIKDGFYNKDLSDLPTNLKKIDLDIDYRVGLSASFLAKIPATVTHLTFGPMFDRPLRNLPP